MSDLIERVPPHDEVAEVSLLASCFLDPDALMVAIEQCRPDDFYRSAHQHIFRAMCELQAKNEIVSFTTVQSQLAARSQLEDVGGLGYLIQLSDGMPNPHGARSYAGTVRERANRRRGLSVLWDGINRLYNLETTEPMLSTLSELMEVTADRDTDSWHEFHEVLGERYGEIYYRSKERPDEAASAFTFGLYDLDHLVRVEQEDMVIIGARPSTGKTALALQIMDHIAQEKRVHFQSLEMARKAIASRYFTLKTGISNHRQMAGSVGDGDLAKLQAVWQKAMDLRFSIDDRSGLTVAQITASIQRRVMKNGEPFGVIVIDHMGKVRPNDSRASKHNQLSQVSNDLKHMARTLKTPVVVLNQLSRDVAKRKGEPELHDIRESGSIEEDADVIMLLHRPDREGDTTPTTLIVGKNRNGPLGRVELVFEGSKTRFVCQEKAPAGGVMPSTGKHWFETE